MTQTITATKDMVFQYPYSIEYVNDYKGGYDNYAYFACYEDEVLSKKDGQVNYAGDDARYTRRIDAVKFLLRTEHEAQVVPAEVVEALAEWFNDLHLVFESEEEQEQLLAQEAPTCLEGCECDDCIAAKPAPTVETPERETTSMTKEITIYEKTNKNGVLHLYCESCKPRGGKRGTLVTGSYDHCCQGCGESFLEKAQDVPPEPDDDDEPCYKDWCQEKVWGYCQQCSRAGCMAHLTRLAGATYLCDDCKPVDDDDELSPSDITTIEKTMSQPDLTYTVEELARLVEQAHKKPSAIMLTGLFDAPCSRCHLPTKGRCQECNVPLCMLCVNTGRDERMVCLGCHVQWIRLQQAWEQLQATASYVEAQFA